MGTDRSGARRPDYGLPLRGVPAGVHPDHRGAPVGIHPQAAATCAAHELLGSPVKVIDLALRYGYTSADAFSAAFKRLHGVTPSAARRGEAPLTFYCRLRFA